MTDQPSRQTGITSQQMRAAEQRALYVWPNGNLYYPQQLARHLGRSDLRIVTLSTLYDLRHFSERILIVIDHAADEAAASGAWKDCDVVLSARHINSLILERRKGAQS